MPRPIRATINTQALSHNLNQVRQRLQGPGSTAPFIWAVIKANAYGHGIENAVAAFQAADGLAMLDLQEAVRCREAGWDGPLLLLEGFFEPADLAILQRYRLAVGLHCKEQLEMLAYGDLEQPIDGFVKLNSGMHRLGFQPQEFAAAFEQARQLQADGVLGQLGSMTHFACADSDAAATKAQLDAFLRETQNLPGALSFCNSAATLTPGLAASVGARDQWVRPGICLYGASPFADIPAADFGLRPAMTLEAQLISVHTLPAGEGIGYGHTYVAAQDTRVGIVACGYADGYPRHAPSGTPVVVDGVRTGLLGRVSMDMLAVDLQDVPGARVGSEVILWGEGGPSVDEVASASGTIGYELLTAVTARVPKIILEAR